MPKFVGRKRELEVLKRFLKKKTASLIVVRGRRRVGKSRLIREFSKPHQYYAFSGIAPTKHTTAQSQRDEFASQLAKQGFPKIQANDWNDLFLVLASKVQTGRVIILLDEISWMGSKDSDFLGKLRNIWDTEFKNNDKLILILCGSASSWIEANILSSTGFVGQVSQTLTLEELPLNDCIEFWGDKADRISVMEKLKILSVTGGIPKYLEEIDPTISAEQNIKNLCFTKGAILVDEFEKLFSNTFLRNSEAYKQISRLLVSGSKEYTEIVSEFNQGITGRVLEYLSELSLAGFVTRDYTWNIDSGRDAKLSQYRLSDNYVRFYLKYIEKNLSKIDRGEFDFKSLSNLTGVDTIWGLQFENLVLNNRQYVWQGLGISPENIISQNPFFQHKTTKQRGCQIDYLIQMKRDTLYVCEIKFSRHPISSKVIDDVKQKIERLKRPKNFSYRPVLIHVNGVSEDVVESDYFDVIIDFGRVLESR